MRSLGRVGGIALLVAVACLWLSLVSWVMTDPSLTHATGGDARNWMGRPGAIISDLVLQMLGFAAVLLTLAPMFWGFDLVTAERVENFRAKSGFFPVSLLLVAGAFSSLPSSENWPLHHGMGGILGDLVSGAASHFLSMITADFANAIAGVALFAMGLQALRHSLGLEFSDLQDLFARTPSSGAAMPEQSWHTTLKAEAQRLREKLHGSPMQYASAAASAAAAPIVEPLSAVWPADRTEPALGPLPPHAVRPAPWGEEQENADLLAPDSEDGFEEAEFATGAGRATREMAERFAPRNGKVPSDIEGVRHDPAAAQLPSVPPVSATSAAATSVLPSILRGRPFRKQPPQFHAPSINLLKRPASAKPGAEFSQSALRGSARLLEDVLADFGVKGEVKDIRPGPVVTLFELEPARGTKSSRIIALADDIARSMSATSVRVAIVPGRNVIGIELPNVRREPVGLREILEAPAFRTSPAALPITLGKSIGGEPVVVDLARMPHLLVAGTTGSGKSVGVNAMIVSLLYRHSPADCRFLMIDPKMLELSVYNGIPHLLAPVVTDPHKAITALNWAVREMEERYKRMSKLAVRNIEAFNTRVLEARQRGETMSRTVQTGFDPATGAALYESQELDLETMPMIVLVVDEFADLMAVAGKEIEAAVQRLAQMARAAGIHLIMATQRPSVDIITGTIKSNFPARISFRVASKIDSRTILNEQGAEQLLGQGDMLFSLGSGQIARVHGAFVSDEEVESIASALREQGEPRYIDGLFDEPGGAELQSGPQRQGGEDDLYDKAVAVVFRDQKATTSYIQRRLSIGYNKAAGLIERMELEGLVGPANPTGKREILAGARRGTDLFSG